MLELDQNEAAVSLCLLRFSNWPGEGLLLAVGTVQGLAFYPRSADGAEGHFRVLVIPPLTDLCRA